MPYEPILGNEQGKDALKTKVNGMLEELYDQDGDLSSLATDDKTSLVAAVNEVKEQNNNLETEGVHQKINVTNTDDATSATDAPLKAAGGLAVAKRAFIAGPTKLQETYFYSFKETTTGASLYEKRFIIPIITTLKVLVSRTVNTSTGSAQGFIEAIVLKGSATNFVITEVTSINKVNAYGDLEIVSDGEELVVRKTAGSGGTTVIFIKIESNNSI